MRILFNLIFLLTFNLSFADPIVSNYTKYKKTNSLIKLEKLDVSFIHPWAISIIDDHNVIVSEKGGGLFTFDLINLIKLPIKHDINHIKYSPGGKQGGLLDVFFDSKDNYVYFTYSHDHAEGSSSTAISRGKIKDANITEYEELLIAHPKLKANLHFGSRIALSGDYLFAGFGERGGGMIAQDPTTHPGSIIRIFKDGGVPNDNPHFNSNPDWLPEIFSVGVRNPQGIAVTVDQKGILFSSHGPRGGDHIALAQHGNNFGWKHIAWGGTEYSFIGIGDTAFDEKYNEPLLSWVPSMAVSSIQFYQGDTFPEWQGDLIVCSLNGESLIRLDFEDGVIVGEEIIIQNNIGRIRDFEIDNDGNILLITDANNSAIWKLTK